MAERSSPCTASSGPGDAMVDPGPPAAGAAPGGSVALADEVIDGLPSRGGRPRLGDAERRTYRLWLPLEREVHDRLLAEATKQGRPLASWVVERIHAVVPRHQARVRPVPTEATLAAVDAAAGRLNAVVHGLHVTSDRQGGAVAMAGRREEVLGVLDALFAALGGVLAEQGGAR